MIGMCINVSKSFVVFRRIGKLYYFTLQLLKRSSVILDYHYYSFSTINRY